MRHPLFLLVLVCFSSCSRYNSLRSKYQFKSPDGNPDYSDLNYWAAHPGKWDPSDSIPAPLMHEPVDSMVDVFFLHPTTYTSKRRMKGSNAAIDDDYTNAKTDYSTILYQASVFNGQCRVFAPRYRQAHITSFFSKNKERVETTFELAYQDLKIAFEYYMHNWNGGRPLIIAAHSQGSMLAERLLKEYFDDGSSRLKNKLVVAYILGWGIPKDYFNSLPVCTDSLQTGCICGWRTLRKGFVPRYLKKENGNSWVTNPLSWTTTNDHASRDLNKGSVLTNFNKIYTRTTDARISNGVLSVKKPKFPGSFFYFTRNYHIGDINLYYLNMRENIARRIAMYWKK
ncbi:MAG TPA: DUF3089 domain-containing protein [Chitinophagaceae bacterium]|nr:DUF3089 domain-containing protein [Chitinophagaceae bacterium]